MGEKFLSLDLLTTILDDMDVELFVSDIHTNEILFINDKMKTHFNLSDAAVGSVCWKVFRPSLDRKCDFCPIHRLLENPGVPIVWEDYDAATGRHYRHTDRMIELPDSKMFHMQHSIDITDIKLTEASLKKRLEQQDLMSAISQSFTTAQDTTYLVNNALKMAGEFMKVNQAFLSKYQKNKNSLRCLYEWCDEHGRPFLGDKHRWPITPDMQIYKDLTTKGYAAVEDSSLLTHPNFKTVQDYDLRAFLNISIDVAGEFWGVLGFVINKHTYNWSKSDIDLGKSITGVFSEVLRRNIAEDNLIKAKEVAEQSSRFKGEFLSRMSHEIRTPMNAITGMTRIAKASDDPKKIEYCLERIGNASKHLLGIINDILDMSKIEANKLELSPAEFDLKKMLTNITSVVNFLIDDKKQNLIINIDKNIPPVLIGDEMRLSQVITNLLSNAAKFTPESGTVLLNISIAELSDDFTALLFEVIDNGIGISKEQQARLFSPFEQADGGIARKFGGTGLGLTISRGIVELMGGRIWIESELGRGAKFSFTVNLKVGKSLPVPKSVNSIKDTPCMRDFQNYTILVAEDIEINREIVFSLLEDTKISIDFAYNGAQALSMVESNPEKYNLILMDIHMPEMDGYEATRRICGLDFMKNRHIPIIAMTANVFREDIEICMQVGMDDHIGKPLDAEELLSKISTHLISNYQE